MWSMYSELGAHPGVVGNLLLALDPESRTITFDREGSVVQRAFWSSASLTYLWMTCKSVAGVGWETWINEAASIYARAGPFMAEASRRQRSGSPT
jgi:hypothetical protein